jgi:phage major head subunit gpT-like protein
MPAITPSFTFDLESNMRVISAQEYQRLNSNLWWRTICKETTSTAKKERVSWLLDTARIQRTGHGGNIEFEDIVSQTQEIENLNAAAGLKIKKEQFEDVDGNGISYASHWSRQVGAYAAYWPQKMLAKAILANPTAYDGLSFFNVAHPVNPFNLAAGTYANLFTGSASGIYPGALKIDVSVTIDVAVQNLAKIIAYIASLKMPNGEDPRFLTLAHLFVPPALVARAQQLTNAKFIAQAASGGAGTADIESVITNFGLGQPVVVTELQSAFGGSDTDFYVGMQEITSNELGAFVYQNREPFSVLYYGPQNDAQLARIREFQWLTEGRNVVMPGHPYLLFKVAGT